jgi:hypothetical protein
MTATQLEGVRQIAVAAAGSNQAAVNVAEVAFFRALIASAKANGISWEPMYRAMQALNMPGG